MGFIYTFFPFVYQFYTRIAESTCYDFFYNFRIFQ